MSIFKASILTFSIGLALSPALASAQEKEDTTIQDATSYLQQIGNTIVTQELIDEAREANRVRDQLRDRSELENLEDVAISSEISKLTSKRDLITLQFIIDNVPPHILAAGQGEVQSYIQHNFIDASKLAESDHRQGPRTVWESTNSALTTPYDNDTPWVPVISDSSSGSRSEPPEVQPEPTPEPQVVEDGGEDGEISITQDESDSLDALGITQAELESMFGALPQQQAVKDEVPERETDSGSNVTIDSIKVNRIVVMGRSSFVNPTISMTVIRSGESRKIQRDFESIRIGYEFDVDDNRFRLEEITSRKVSFRNLKTNVLYEESVQ